MTERQMTMKSEACPKAVWVMSTLADDELTDGTVELPAGLAFHLNRCASCRVLAESLQAVSRGLQALSLTEPADHLEDRAVAQLEYAFAHGARLTGRVQIPTDEESISIPIQAWPRRWFDWGNLAVAAAVMISVLGIYVSYRLSREPDSGIVQQLHSPPTDKDFILVKPGEITPVSSQNSHLAAAAKSNAGKPAQPRRHHNHMDAAFSDEEGAVQYGVVLPDPATRGVTIVPWIDKPVESDSNKPFQKDN